MENATTTSPNDENANDEKSPLSIDDIDISNMEGNSEDNTIVSTEKNDNEDDNDDEERNEEGDTSNGYNHNNEFDDDESAVDDDDDDDDDDETATTYVDEMPVFHYSRIVSTGLPNMIDDIDTDDDGDNSSSDDPSTAAFRQPPRSSCSELTVVRVDPEELISAAAAAAADSNNRTTETNNNNNNHDDNNNNSTITATTSALSSSTAVVRNRNEQALLLSSDLWRQPHMVIACGWDSSSSSSSSGSGKVTFTRVQRETPTPGSRNGANSSNSSSSPSVVFVMPSKTNTASGGDPTSSSGTITSNSNSNNNNNNNAKNNATTELYVREQENSSSWSSGRSVHDDTSVVDMSFDASGTALGAVDEGGHCAIWEFKYTTSLQSNLLVFGDNNSNSNNVNENNNSITLTTTSEEGSTTPTSTRPQAATTSSPMRSAGNNNMFSNFMSALTGMPPAEESRGGNNASGGSANNNNVDSRTRQGVANSTRELIPTLTAEISYQSRVNYPANWGPPTCMVIDPAYKRKREKSLLVGFASGRLVLTKRGTFFQRRNDSVIYQAPHGVGGGGGGRGKNKDKNGDDDSSSYRGIETVVWRGSLVAWADATGIKLMDMDQLTRIAHIDRPAGARPTLYPSVRNIIPSLHFETSHHLLVGWGDCLMQIYVEEHDDDPHGGASSLSVSTGGTDGSSTAKKRRTVACTMAWELDCVACDVVPLDAEHVMVLGLVPPVVDDEENNDDDDDDTKGEKGSSFRRNELEIQVLSRKDGTITYCDSLPLTKDNAPISSSSNPNESIDSVLDFRLLSSFALPRMELAEETKVLKAMEGANDMGFIGIDVNFDINQPLFAGADSSAKKTEFRDPHSQWKIQSILYDENDDETDVFDTDDDDHSVDSDDYECILRPIETIQPLSTQATGANNDCFPPPTMVICTASDAILSVTSTIDDAVESSLTRQKYALALSRGLCHKRQLRRYDINELINRYLGAVLRIPQSKNEYRLEEQSAQKTTTATTTTTIKPISLSLRRMQLAVKAMPVLLGDRIGLWERWTGELEKIPGSLFFLRNYLPVRDPILPSNIFVRVLGTMLTEVEHISHNSKKDSVSSTDIHTEAANHFLESLLAWGSTKVLKEYISFYKYNKERQNEEKSIDKDIRATQISLQRRYLQTAAGYLIFPVRDVEEELEVSAPRYEVHNDDTEDSLFDISEVVTMLASRVPLVASRDDFGNLNGTGNKAHLSYTLTPNNHTCLEAMARLRMMQGDYDLALKCFLAIGACHSKESLQSFENTAIRVVNGTSDIATEDSTSPIGTHSYEFVMSLIESQNLNQFLFEKDFLLSTSTDSKLFMPIFALIRLVGLRRVGNFLIEHCVAPGFAYNMTLEEANNDTDSPDSPSSDGSNARILRRGPLPIDKVAEQLESSPALLHWYLHLVLTRRPEFYVNFPTSSTPPKAVTNLHRKHFQLYVDFAGEMRDSSKVLAGTEAYKVESKTTPLLIFLEAALPLGGVIPVDVRRVLEIERSKDSDDNNNTGGDDKGGGSRELSSPIFALELAYVIEKYNEQTETDALGILNLYLKGAQSLALSVSYAQRQKKFSSVLWDHLISYCLKKASDGAKFGELLEAAALSGADLGRLVEQIPPGMVVEGLRPRLVAAVADYRMKLEIYEAAMAAGSQEEINLMREIGHRVRRGVRYDLEKYSARKSFAELIHEKIIRDNKEAAAAAMIIDDSSKIDDDGNDGKSPSGATLYKITKTRIRRGHQRLAYSISRR